MKAAAIALCTLLAAPAAADGFRIGMHVAGGAAFPAGTPVGGGGIRLGVQRDRVGFLVELGGFGGFAQDTGDPAHRRVSAVFMGGITPMVEVDLDARTFASAGLVLGGGTWTRSVHATDEAGTVRTQSGGVVGDPFVHVLSGADFRIGWRRGTRHHLTIACGIQLLFARGHAASATVSLDGAMRSATDTREVAFLIWPSLSIGWDFKR